MKLDLVVANLGETSPGFSVAIARKLRDGDAINLYEMIVYELRKRQLGIGKANVGRPIERRLVDVLDAQEGSEEERELPITSLGEHIVYQRTTECRGDFSLQYGERVSLKQVSDGVPDYSKDATGVVFNDPEHFARIVDKNRHVLVEIITMGGKVIKMEVPENVLGKRNPLYEEYSGYLPSDMAGLAAMLVNECYK